MKPQVHIFWDNSNIFIGAKSVAQEREHWSTDKTIRINFETLYKLAAADRTVVSAVCIGSVPPELETVWDRIEKMGVTVECLERGRASGKEQGVDQSLQVHMLRSLADAAKPSVAVLLTGDGKGYCDGVGFHADLERMAKKNWGIEVISWDKCCNGRLKSWASKEGIYIKLEDYYDAVTFLEGSRQPKPLSLKNRKFALPSREIAVPA